LQIRQALQLIVRDRLRRLLVVLYFRFYQVLRRKKGEKGKKGQFSYF
jgi:hypothetical protein